MGTEAGKNKFGARARAGAGDQNRGLGAGKHKCPFLVKLLFKTQMCIANEKIDEF